MTRLLEEGFENVPIGVAPDTTNTGLDNSFGTASPVASSSAALFGSRGIEIAANGLYYSLEKWLPANTNVTYARWYQRLSAASSSGQTVIAQLNYNDTSNLAQVTNGPPASGGILNLRRGTLKVASTVEDYTGKWVRLEWDVNTSTGVQTLRVYADDDLHGTTPTETISGDIASFAISRVRIGTIGSPGSPGWTQYIDQFAVDDAASPGPYVPDVPTGPTVALWDGSSEVPVTVNLWDGSAEVPVTLETS